MSAVNREQVLHEVMQWAEQSGYGSGPIADSPHDFVIEISENRSLPSVQVVHQRPDHAFVLLVGYVSIPEADRNKLKEWAPAQFTELIWDIKMDLQRAGVDFTVLGEDDKDPQGWEVQKRLYVKGSGPNQFQEVYSKIKHSLIGIIWSYKRALDLMQHQTGEVYGGRYIAGGSKTVHKEGAGMETPGEPLKLDTDRSRRIINAMMNTSIILMTTLMDGFGQMMMETVGAMASGMAEFAGGEEAGEEVADELQEKGPEAMDQMRAMISEIRRDIYAQVEAKRAEIEPFLVDRAFDAGPEMIEVYDFGLPKLTEELDDETIAQYVRLLVQEDRYFTELFGELTKWINTLPELPK